MTGLIYGVFFTGSIMKASSYIQFLENLHSRLMSFRGISRSYGGCS
jgi:hypothetical protein